MSDHLPGFCLAIQEAIDGFGDHELVTGGDGSQTSFLILEAADYLEERGDPRVELLRSLMIVAEHTPYFDGFRLRRNGKTVGNHHKATYPTGLRYVGRELLQLALEELTVQCQCKAIRAEVSRWYGVPDRANNDFVDAVRFTAGMVSSAFGVPPRLLADRVGDIIDPKGMTCGLGCHNRGWLPAHAATCQACQGQGEWMAPDEFPCEELGIARGVTRIGEEDRFGFPFPPLSEMKVVRVCDFYIGSRIAVPVTKSFWHPSIELQFIDLAKFTTKSRHTYEIGASRDTIYWRPCKSTCPACGGQKWTKTPIKPPAPEYPITVEIPMARAPSFVMERRDE